MNRVQEISAKLIGEDRSKLADMLLILTGSFGVMIDDRTTVNVAEIEAAFSRAYEYSFNK